MKRDINRKVSAILSLGREQNNISNKISYTNFYLYSSSSYENLKEEYKILTALNLNSEKFRNLTEEDLKKFQTSSYYEMYKDYYDTITVYEEEEIANTYDDLFGEVINNKSIENCPLYNYDNVNKVYYRSSECGGTGMPTVIGYIYNYSEEDNNIYIDLVLGTIDIENNVYTDIYVNNENSTATKYTKTLVSNTIDENNYQDFIKYKMTFKKEDNRYYFSKFEKI